MFECEFLHLFPSVTDGSLFDDYELGNLRALPQNTLSWVVVKKKSLFLTFLAANSKTTVAARGLFCGL